jgi:hypothetical protein
MIIHYCLGRRRINLTEWLKLAKRIVINDSWVLQREGSFSTSFSGFLSQLTGGLKLYETMKSGLEIARASTDFEGLGIIKPILDRVVGSIDSIIPPKKQAEIQKKIEEAQKTAQKNLDKAEVKLEQQIEVKMRETEDKLDAKIEKRLAQMEADQNKMEDTVGQQIAYQLFGSKVDSLVDALYSVAQERGITNQEILKIIKALPKFEALMYIMNVRKFYRDHTAHSLRVAVLGDYLLDKEGSTGGLEGLLREKLNFTKEELRTTWWFTGLLHDIGTPLAKLSSSINWSLINEMIRCYSPLGLDFLPLQISVNHPELGNSGYLKILCEGFPKPWQEIITNGLGEGAVSSSVFRYSPNNQNRIEYKPSSSRIDHGVIAAITLLRTLGSPENIMQDKMEHRPLIEAARAIALHDSIERLQPLAFKDYPLLFLLAISDELQEWGRPIPVSSEDGYFTTAHQKVTLTNAIFHSPNLELWDIPFTNAQAKTLMGFDFKRLQNDKETKLRVLDCTEQFPETDLLLINFEKSASEVSDKYLIKISSH